VNSFVLCDAPHVDTVDLLRYFRILKDFNPLRI